MVNPFDWRNRNIQDNNSTLDTSDSAMSPIDKISDQPTGICLRNINDIARANGSYEEPIVKTKKPKCFYTNPCKKKNKRRYS